MSASKLLLGHTHPTVMLKDRLQYETYETCWVKTSLDSQKAKERYETFNENIEIIILPAFNPLCGGMAVNKDGIMGPMNSIIRLSESTLFLLDGSYLGSIDSLNAES
jgi:metallophosphoesterase superfamily enzyme